MITVSTKMFVSILKALLQTGGYVGIDFDRSPEKEISQAMKTAGLEMLTVSNLSLVWNPSAMFAEWVYWGNLYREVELFLKDRGFVLAASDNRWERDLFIGPANADLREMPYQG